MKWLLQDLKFNGIEKEGCYLICTNENDFKLDKEAKQCKSTKEIMFGSPEAKLVDSFRKETIETKEKCEEGNRLWDDVADRCMRVCKDPRTSYRFSRKKYRCFRYEKPKCGRSMRWDRKEKTCVFKEIRV